MLSLMARAMSMGVGLPRPDGWEVQVYHHDVEICAVAPAALIAAALGEGAGPEATRAWLLANEAALCHAAIALAAGRHAPPPFDGLRILGSASCR
jgi:hypothetical protein